jgi:hypothetical protein
MTPRCVYLFASEPATLITHGVLDGWKATQGEQDRRNSPRGKERPELIDLSDAIQQITYLQKVLQKRQIEVEVLIEALDYARSIVSLANDNDWPATF